MPKHHPVPPRPLQKQTRRETLQVLAVVPLGLSALLILITFTYALFPGVR